MRALARTAAVSRPRSDAPLRPPQDGVRSQESDADLVLRVQRGETSAYRFLVERYQRRLFAVLYGMLHNREDAREVAQDSFVKAYNHLDRFRFDSSFYTWLYRIAVNLAIDLKRRHSSRPHAEYDDARQHDEPGALDSRDHTAFSPGHRLERKRLLEHIEAAIAELPDEQRQAIVLREIDGLSYKEIAEVMECPEGTVMSRLFYGRKKLQELLADQR